MKSWCLLIFALHRCRVLLAATSAGTATGAEIDTDAAWYERKVRNHETGSFQSSRLHVLRLGPQEDLLESLFRYSRVLDIRAASIASAVGSLQHASIRYADQENGQGLSGPFEIVSLVGNIDFQGDQSNKDEESGHVHISVSDGRGVTVGGHLLKGSLVYTTAEITLVEIINATFYRELDDAPGGSGYFELKVRDD